MTPRLTRSPHGMRPLAAGFSLVELLIVLVIIAIIGAFAYPSYIQQVVKSNRADATIALTRIAQSQERYYTENLSYAHTLDALREQGETRVRGKESHYTLALVPEPAGCGGTANDRCEGFTLTAEPNSALQKSKDKECTEFSIDHTGRQGANESDDAEIIAKCWR
ncbi:MAG: type IV pilin protein [Thiotrichales bacterium]